MNLPATGLPELAYREGQLHFCGQAIETIAARTGTPAFVYSESRLHTNARAFQEAFPPPRPWKIHLAYSLKTAWEPKLLEILRRLGMGAEAACAHELELALQAGFRPKEIILDGPTQHAELVPRAMQVGVRYLKVDSLDQLKLLARATGQGQLGICLRLRAPTGKMTHPLAYLEGRFGMGEAEIEEALAFISSTPNLALKGFALHLGSQITAVQKYRRALRALALACRRAGDLLADGAEANLGGGFPSATMKRFSPLNLLAHRLSDGRGRIPRLEEFGRSICDDLPRAGFPEKVRCLTLEPGRALVGNAALLLCRVVAAKRDWLFTDASRNFVPESLLFATRRFLPSQPRSGPAWKRVNLAGCTLHGGDVLALGCRLPPCLPGDLLVMLDAGAYTLSRANVFTTPVPPAYLLDAEGKLRLLRRKESSEDVAARAKSW